MGRWLTRDAQPGTVCRAVLIPDDPIWRADLLGAITQLSKSHNWEQAGTLTPDEMAAAWLDILWTLDFERRCMEIGTIQFTASDELPGYALWCDGAEYDQSAYPDLFSKIGTFYGSSGAGKFNVPNLCRRFPIGTDGLGQGFDLADTGGEQTHTLTTQELPNHSHSVHAHLASMAQLGVGEPVTIPDILTGETGATGGGNAHNNMPPFLALNAYIIAT